MAISQVYRFKELRKIIFQGKGARKQRNVWQL